MRVTESEAARQQCATHSQGLLPHGELSLQRDHHHVGQEGDEVDDQHRQDGQRRSAEEGTDEIAAERKHIQGEKAWACTVLITTTVRKSVSMSVYVSVRACMCECVRACVCACTCVCRYMCVHVCMSVHEDSPHTASILACLKSVHHLFNIGHERSMLASPEELHQKAERSH